MGVISYLQSTAEIDRHSMAMGDLGSWIVLLLLGFIGGYYLYKLFQLYFADADLVTSRKSLRPEYFRDKVVWVTGASSGSKV